MLEGVRHRNPQALGSFFDHYFDRLWAVVCRFFSDPALAEETLQEIFFRVWKAADRLDASRDPGPWLFTIAYNECRGVWRTGAHRMRRSTRSWSVADAESLVDVSDPESEFLRRERLRRLDEALMQLPASQRAIVLLHDVEGLTHVEIAGIVGLRHEAVRKRYSRALTALQSVLGGESS